MFDTVQEAARVRGTEIVRPGLHEIAQLNNASVGKEPDFLVTNGSPAPVWAILWTLARQGMATIIPNPGTHGIGISDMMVRTRMA
jgi:hypothetical protein